MENQTIYLQDQTLQQRRVSGRVLGNISKSLAGLVQQILQLTNNNTECVRSMDWTCVWYGSLRCWSVEMLSKHFDCPQWLEKPFNLSANQIHTSTMYSSKQQTTEQL